MKKIIIFFAAFLLITSAYAQQRPQYTQYVTNYFLINPAAAGMEKDMSLNASFRKQWAGLNGSPSTSYLTYNTALGHNKFVKDTFSVKDKYPAIWDRYSAKDNSKLFTLAEPHHSIGFTVINDEAGALNRFVAYCTYAYHLQLSSKLNLSAGISGGLSTMHIRQHKLGLEITVDPAAYNYTEKIKADVNAGLLLYGERFFAGVSVQQIIPSKIIFNGNSINLFGERKFPDLFVSAGYHFPINSDINILPSVMLKYINNIPVTFDVNAKIDYKDLVWAGGSYRYKSGVAAFAGLRLNDDTKFGYSFDLTTSGLQRVSSGTHEFLLAFTIRRREP